LSRWANKKHRNNRNEAARGLKRGGDICPSQYRHRVARRYQQRNRMSSFIRHAAAGLAAAFACTLPAHAALVTYEGFDYAPGSGLVGADGGTGFASSWVSGLFSGGAQQSVQAGSLNYSGMPGAGNHTAQGSQAGYWGVYRPLASNFGADGTTMYASFLIRGTTGMAPADFFGMYLHGSSQDLFIGKGGGGVTEQWVLEQRGGLTQAASGQSVGTETTLLVVKMAFGAASDEISLYVNPSWGGAQPLADVTTNLMNLGSISGLGLFGSHAYEIDEIRLGQSFADVAGGTVPEPAPWMLILPGLVAAGALRKRRVAQICRPPQK
jgi:hypothetical protein